VLDPAQIVQSRTGVGGAAPGEVTRMAAGVARQAAEMAAGAQRWRSRYQRAEDDLIAAARGYAEETGETASQSGGQR
jgi:hypothetical protein